MVEDSDKQEEDFKEFMELTRICQGLRNKETREDTVEELINHILSGGGTDEQREEYEENLVSIFDMLLEEVI